MRAAASSTMGLKAALDLVHFPGEGAVHGLMMTGFQCVSTLKGWKKTLAKNVFLW